MTPSYPYKKRKDGETMAIYIGLAVADSMFPADCLVERESLTPQEVLELMAGYDVVSCVNPSHKTTLEALRMKYGIEVPIPEQAPKVSLRGGEEGEAGDSIIVLSARFPRRLAEGEVWTQEEVDTQAEFKFGIWTVLLGAS